MRMETREIKMSNSYFLTSTVCHDTKQINQSEDAALAGSLVITYTVPISHTHAGRRNMACPHAVIN